MENLPIEVRDQGPLSTIRPWWMSSARSRRLLPPGMLDGLADVSLSLGRGAQMEGLASARGDMRARSLHWPLPLRHDLRCLSTSARRCSSGSSRTALGAACGTSRVRCVCRRRQVAAGKWWAIALTRPPCAPETTTTRSTLDGPRRLSPPSKLDQVAADSRSPSCKPRISRSPAAFTPMASEPSQARWRSSSWTLSRRARTSTKGNACSARTLPPGRNHEIAPRAHPVPPAAGRRVPRSRPGGMRSRFYTGELSRPLLAT